MAALTWCKSCFLTTINCDFYTYIPGIFNPEVYFSPITFFKWVCGLKFSS